MELPIIRSVQTLTKKVDNDKKALLMRRTKSIVGNTFYYVLLFSLSFVFVYPLLYMISQSFMRPADVADATVQWLPKVLTFQNYVEAFKSINYWNGLLNSMWISFGSAILQIISCSFIGYGFARYKFPLKGLWLALLVFTFLVPPQTIVVPLYIFFSDLGWINTLFPFIFPALFGFGLKGALFVLIFIQFYLNLPKVLEEAAKIDGAGPFRTYWTIMFPLAKPAMVVVFLFSVVWNWNDVFQPNMYLLVPDYFNLAQNLSTFNGNANAQGVNQMQQMVSASDAFGLTPTLLNQIMAAVMLTILPIVILYLFVQRAFVEGIERSGISGE
ncbi:carbohydrate ABC transporter permease [Lederbergia wuyishanensis]|uniref:Multiple sugar transport system permease protein n=1 Tax=Lederbergia wuyishanensis TaxID=1347903 RepID=A0ABU0D9F3_9BACI|nr:carbohydrate ABC transporter permease [Lederbergia wuyishanensis]MCJ8007507.1 carbohydrate ABC transporter permease [Lederbergia wuyishanensis]MDQ0345054.1 multiple sugar transport system permease protein [Lederbergia wuyishanensis]